MTCGQDAEERSHGASRRQRRLIVVELIIDHLDVKTARN